MREPSLTDPFVVDLCQEVIRAESLYPALHSYHEAYGVLAEELAEFFDQTRLKDAQRNPITARRELVQLAAMAFRAARDLGMEPTR
jgi:hypothetical protein